MAGCGLRAAEILVLASTRRSRSRRLERLADQTDLPENSDPIDQLAKRRAEAGQPVDFPHLGIFTAKPVCRRSGDRRLRGPVARNRGAFRIASKPN
ncbi:hypothetical protein ACFSC3_08970 [Sphingomonas floccifaciens]|uniref:Uncharacterized protein n=1 Tax=Sphingomonas floccifaciens TaxID=1844115 RepID=A0ABW4NDB4_9SPHN